MSDGPHRSLPMRRGWKRVAKCGDNNAFTLEEVSTSIVYALEEDSRSEFPDAFMKGLCDLCREHETSLFKDQMGLQLEGLRQFAGYGMGRAVLDHALLLSENGERGLAIAEKAVVCALTDRAARGARQVEEHYCRESRQPRAYGVRARIEDAIGSSSPAFNALARKILEIEPSSAPLPVIKQQGLEDGVRL
jgi:hypothetical protein